MERSEMDEYVKRTSLSIRLASDPAPLGLQSTIEDMERSSCNKCLLRHWCIIPILHLGLQCVLCTLYRANPICQSFDILLYSGHSFLLIFRWRGWGLIVSVRDERYDGL